MPIILRMATLTAGWIGSELVNIWLNAGIVHLMKLPHLFLCPDSSQMCALLIKSCSLEGVRSLPQQVFIRIHLSFGMAGLRETWIRHQGRKTPHRLQNQRTWKFCFEVCRSCPGTNSPPQWPGRTCSFELLLLGFTGTASAAQTQTTDDIRTRTRSAGNCVQRQSYVRSDQAPLPIARLFKEEKDTKKGLWAERAAGLGHWFADLAFLLALVFVMVDTYC